MSVDNAIQFALVREDPALEVALIDRTRASSVLLVASGGCSALTIAAAKPDVALTLLDMNRAQLDLVERKLAFLRSTTDRAQRRRAFGCDSDDASSLVGCGNFESLFRCLRAVVDDLVMPHAERVSLLRTHDAAKRARLVANKYWPVAFSLFFSDAILEAMFTKAATQHAAPGSYPTYFQRVIERGLEREDASTNAWLQQFLLGFQLVEPPYLAHDFSATKPFSFVHAKMQDAPDFARFDVVSLSNLFDWMNAADIRAIANRMRAECKSGAHVVVRQLNNQNPIERDFAPEFVVDEALSRDLLLRDRSLFYERIVVLVKR